MDQAQRQHMRWEGETGMKIDGGRGMTIQNTKQWFEAAVPEPTENSRAVQLGCHLEEVVEMLENLAFDTPQADADASIASHYLTHLSLSLKAGDAVPTIIDRTDHLDALCDQIVTAVGCAHMEGMDIQGALAEVNRSNWSKFVDGKPVFDENGKIKK